MNASTLSTITGVLGIINPALGVIGSLVASFGGGDTGAKFNKVSGQVKDAANVVSSLAPLLQQFADGEDVTPDQVRGALVGMDAALSEFDALIAAKSA